jgi:hypothetical protein
MGGRIAAADDADAAMIAILLEDVAAMGQRGQQWRAATSALPPSHVDGSNDGKRLQSAPCLLLLLLAAAAAQGRRHGDDGDNGNDDGNDGVHSNGGKLTHILVLTCFVILCLLLF